tara:strand:- start:909 stop:1397 length:489 start_codon:yes stop_codon:yes gene_type:complete
MTDLEYTLEEISYSRKEDSRILEAVLKNWFKDPKSLNFVDPRMSFPFQFKEWLKLSYQTEQTITTILKKDLWIIGYLSMHLRLERKNCYLFHLFIDPQFRNKGLAQRITKEMETYGKQLGAQSFSIFLVPKNVPAKNLYSKLGYEERGQSINGLIKLHKKII